MLKKRALRVKKQKFREWQLKHLQELDTKQLEKLIYRLDMLDQATDNNPPKDKPNT